MLYQYLKFLHLASVILLAGNVFITGFWKYYADKTNNGVVIGFGQHLVNKTDWFFSVIFGIGAAVSGYGMAILAGYDLFGSTWLIWGQINFWFSFVVWVFILIPIQIKMTRMSEKFEHGGEVGENYRRWTIYWYIAGNASTIPLYLNIYFMVAKPV